MSDNITRKAQTGEPGNPGEFGTRARAESSVALTVPEEEGRAPATFTLDALTPDGKYASDHGLTTEEVAAARVNAPRLGITILAVVEETPVSPEMLAPLLGVDAVARLHGATQNPILEAFRADREGSVWNWLANFNGRTADATPEQADEAFAVLTDLAERARDATPSV